MSILQPPTKVTRPEVSVASRVVTLADVDIRSELDARPMRHPDFEREHHALAVLGAEMAANPRNMLQTLVEIALDLCDAGTAGITLVEGDTFHWEAVAGVFAAARGRAMPRDESPCRVCVDRNAPQLMHLPDRCFSAWSAEPRFVEVLLVPFHDRGMPIGTVWIASHHAERKFNREDERIVRVLSAFASAGWLLWRAYEAAAETNLRKDRFLATLGHELRNPLGAMTTAASVLQQSVSSENDHAIRAVGVITRQCRHVSRLADDLLDAGRIGSGKLQLDLSRADLHRIVAEAIEMCRPKIEERGLQLELDLDLAGVWVDADRVRLVQVFSNLIDNAVKYTPPGGRIAITTSTSDQDVTLSVHDTGEGIPSDQLHQIFEPFTQLRDPRESSTGGIGLGLSLVRSLTELHGGSVTAVSQGPGHGSCFTVRLPLPRAEQIPA